MMTEGKRSAVGLSIDERNALLERAWELRAALDYPGLLELLTSVPSDALLAEPELGYLLAAARWRTGNGSAALRLLQDLVEPCRKCGNTWVSRNRMNLEAIVLREQGRLAEAETLWVGLLDAAREAGDEQGVVLATMNLGIVADVQCRWEDAVANYQQGMAVCQRLGDRALLGCIHQNLAMAFRQLAFLHEADTHFQKALDHFRAAGSEDQVGFSEMERAILLNLIGDSHLAEATVRRALQRFRGLGHLAGEGDCLRVLGIIVAGQGKRDEARQYFRAALKIVRRAIERLTEAQVLEEMAVLEQEEGNEVPSAEMAEEACAIYLELGAPLRAQTLRVRLVGQEQGRSVSYGAR